MTDVHTNGSTKKIQDEGSINGENVMKTRDGVGVGLQNIVKVDTIQRHI